MEIKVSRIEDGPARIEVVNPESGEVVSWSDVNVGEQASITTSDSAEDPPRIGEPVAIAQEPAAAETSGEEKTAPSDGAQEPGSEGQPVPAEPGQEPPAAE